MANMIPISTVTVGSGGVNAIEFTNIPQNYTDLLIKISGRSTSVNVQDRIGLKINGNAYGNWTLRWLGNAAGSAVSYTESALGSNNINYIPGDTVTASTFGNVEIYIPNYTSSNYKSISIDGVIENNSTSVYFGLEAALWSNTSPINQLTFSTVSVSNYAQYSSATLYGIRKY